LKCRRPPQLGLKIHATTEQTLYKTELKLEIKKKDGNKNSAATVYLHEERAVRIPEQKSKQIIAQNKMNIRRRLLPQQRASARIFEDDCALMKHRVMIHNIQSHWVYKVKTSCTLEASLWMKCLSMDTGNTPLPSVSKCAQTSLKRWISSFLTCACYNRDISWSEQHYVIGIDAIAFWTESCSRTTTYNNANNRIVAFEQENERTNREQIKEDAASKEEERVEVSEVKSEIDGM
jgi:hypothetical protein